MKAKVVRLTVKVTKDVTYGDAPLQKLDFYEPDKPNGAAILDIHGGGWFRGEKQKESDMAKRFAALGYHVAVPNYRLAPADFFPAARDDVLAAFSWLRTHAQVENLGVFGSSAGGSLAVDVGLAEGVQLFLGRVFSTFGNGLRIIQQLWLNPIPKRILLRRPVPRLIKVGAMIHFTSGSS